MPTIDFSKVKTLKPIPEGWHKARIDGAQETVSKQGNKMIAFNWVLDDGAEEGEFAGRKVYDNVMLETDAVWRTVLVFQAVDLIDADLDPQDEEAVQALGELEFELDDLVGLEADIKTANEEFEGRLNPKVKGVRAPRPTMEAALS